MASDAIKILAKNLRAILRNKESILKSAVERHAGELADIQRFQMQKGENALGGEIGVLASTAYGAEKKASGGIAPLGVVDLSDTGDFQKGISVKVLNKGLIIKSSEGKTTSLIQKYGDKIFGYNEESKSNIRRLIIPSIRFELRRRRLWR